MALISADLFQLSAVQLVNEAIPATPAWLRARLSSETVAYQPQSANSAELNPLGQLADTIQTGARSGGAVELPLTRHPYFDAALAAVFRSSWSANSLIVGSVLPLFAVEKRFPDPASPGSYIYHRFNKCAVSQVGINIGGAEITASVTYSGGSADFVETMIAGSTYADPGAHPVFTSPQVTEVSVAGITNALCFQNLSIEFNGNVRAVECIGTLGAKEQVPGRFEATLRGSVYFVSNALLDYLISQASFACSVELSDTAGNKYELTFPRCKMTAGGANAGGTGQDILSNISIQALYDTGSGTTCTVTRTQV
jgi:hypothetical protein